MVFDARRHIPNLRTVLRRYARWLELEAQRGYTGVIDDDGKTSSDRSREYAANYRWLVELMDAGRRVTADSHGVFVDGVLASEYARRGVMAAQRAERRSASKRQLPHR